jgi:hypothetical protein
MYLLYIFIILIITLFIIIIIELSNIFISLFIIYLI